MYRIGISKHKLTEQGQMPRKEIAFTEGVDCGAPQFNRLREYRKRLSVDEPGRPPNILPS